MMTVKYLTQIKSNGAFKADGAPHFSPMLQQEDHTIAAQSKILGL